MTTVPGFTVDVDHNPYLPTGGRLVSAVVTVTADAPEDTPLRPPGAGRAEIIIVDRSGSMAMPADKIAAARAATAAAVDVIGDGVWFAWPRRPSYARGRSGATAGAWAPAGRSASCARSPARRTGSSCLARAWSGRRGPRTRRCRPGSTRRWRITRARRSWPRRSRRGWRPASAGTRRRGDGDRAAGPGGGAGA